MHRAGSPRGGEVDRLREGRREVLRAHHEVVVLHGRHQDAGGIRLLEAVSPDQVARHVACDEEHRHRVHHRVLHRGHEVGGARPRGGERDAELARGARVGVRRVPASLLVPHEDVAHLRVCGQTVVERQHHAARVPEDGGGAGALQALQHDVGARHHAAVGAAGDGRQRGGPGGGRLAGGWLLGRGHRSIPVCCRGALLVLGVRGRSRRPALERPARRCEFARHAGEGRRPRTAPPRSVRVREADRPAGRLRGGRARSLRAP